MRHHTAALGKAPAESSRSFRLDPRTLPTRYTLTLGNDAGRANATVILDREQAIIQRLSPNGTPLTLRIPTNAFDGVAVRMRPVGQFGEIEVVVELMHRDPALSLPLAIADDPVEIVTDWQDWGQTLDLPLLIVEQDGTVVAPLDQQDPVAPQAPQPRRHHSYFAKRRPRFLTRRKTGRPVQLERLNGREIIARD